MVERTGDASPVSPAVVTPLSPYIIYAIYWILDQYSADIST